MTSELGCPAMATEFSLTATEKRVLAALSRRPRGLQGVRSVALVAGVSLTEARAALAVLADRGLATTEPDTDIDGDAATPRTVWRLAVGDAWFDVAGEVREVELPRLDPAPMPKRLPERFAHLFWWGDPGLIELPRDAAFVAEHMLTCHDIDAWAWALDSLPTEALEFVADKDVTPAGEGHDPQRPQASRWARCLIARRSSGHTQRFDSSPHGIPA